MRSKKNKYSLIIYFLFILFWIIANMEEASGMCKNPPCDDPPPPPPPAAPSNLTATSPHCHRVDLNWDEVQNATSYKYYRSEISGFQIGPDTYIGDTPFPPTQDEGDPQPSHTYYYKVTAVNEGVEGDPSNETSVTLNGSSRHPQNLTAEAQAYNKIYLQWEKSICGDDASYKIYRSLSQDFDCDDTTYIATTNDLFYTDNDLAGNTTYYYKVTWYKEGEEEYESNTASARTPSDPYLEIGELNARAISFREIKLNWGKVEDPSLGHYNVYKSTSSGFQPSPTTLIATTDREYFSDFSVKNNVTYYYKVSFTREDTGEEGAPSNEAEATPFDTEVITYSYGGDFGGPHALTSDGVRTFKYDAAGNLSQRDKPNSPSVYYQYAASNMLRSIRVGDDTIAVYYYDMDGKRIMKEADGVTTRFFDPTLVVEGSSERFFYFAENTRIAEERLNEDKIYFFLRDHLGSTSIITDETGAIVSEIEYYPFGAVKSIYTDEKIFEQGEPFYKYQDKYQDRESDLYYFESRYYDASLGRFTTADTLLPNPNNPQELNRYSFTKNNPLLYIDPTGHESIPPDTWKEVMDKYEKYGNPQFIVKEDDSLLLAVNIGESDGPCAPPSKEDTAKITGEDTTENPSKVGKAAHFASAATEVADVLISGTSSGLERKKTGEFFIEEIANDIVSYPLEDEKGKRKIVRSTMGKVLLYGGGAIASTFIKAPSTKELPPIILILAPLIPADHYLYELPLNRRRLDKMATMVYKSHHVTYLYTHTTTPHKLKPVKEIITTPTESYMRHLREERESGIIRRLYSPIR